VIDEFHFDNEQASGLVEGDAYVMNLAAGSTLCVAISFFRYVLVVFLLPSPSI
jgi:hypothetical protein